MRLDRGFTLIEVIVALSILGIAITVILQLFSANLKAVSKSEDYVNALVLADQKMRELSQSDDISEKTWTEMTELGYRFDISVYEILKERTETLHVRLLEIQLTVSWLKGYQQKSHTFKTLKVVEKKIQ
jgi:general secretion pathway protein I